MKKVLLDLNIILDFLNKRHDHVSAVKVFDLCIKKSLKGYMCSHEITTLSYFLDKEHYSRPKFKKFLLSILDNFTVVPAIETVFRKALNSEIDDFEDAVIDESAQKEKVDCIITRNLNDFKKSKVPAYTAGEFLALISVDSQ
ncbi:MAG: PIN domain-containing protein [Spirochaetia bacterium]